MFSGPDSAAVPQQQQPSADLGPHGRVYPHHPSLQVTHVHLESSDPEDDEHGEASDAESDSGELWSPQTGIRYRLADAIPEESDLVNVMTDIFNRASPPEIFLSRARFHDGVYAFEMKELVSRTVRVGPAGSRYSKPLCESCAGDSDGGGGACRHSTWLEDVIAGQSAGPSAGAAGAVLAIGPDGHALGDAYPLIADFRLRYLAARLNCRVAPPAGETRVPADRHRVAEVKRMLSFISGQRFDQYDETMLGRKSRQVEVGDLGLTLFRILYHSDACFDQFRSQLNHQGQFRDRFQQLRVDAEQVFDLLEYGYLDQPAAAATIAERPCDVPWAAGHIRRIAAEIKLAVETTSAPLGLSDRQSAADTLIFLLHQVVLRTSRDYDDGSGLSSADRNLYFNLIGAQDENFVIELLARLTPEATRSLPLLKWCFETVCAAGAPQSYLDRFHAVVTKLRTACGEI